MNTFKNWSKSSYYIYSIGAIILTILSLTTSAITVYSVLSLIGALFGFFSGVALLMMATYIMYTINASTAFFNSKWFAK